MHCILVRCYLPKSVGRCRASTPKYYYNAENQACEQFNYGGCLGNANKFDTSEECEQQCVLTQTAGSWTAYSSIEPTIQLHNCS